MHCLSFFALLLGATEALVAPARHHTRRAQKQQQQRRRGVAPVNALGPLDVSSLTTAYEFSGSYASLYATLALFVTSFPGLYSLIKRSTKVQLVQKKYVFDESSEFNGMNAVAAEVMGYMKANNYEVADAGEVITFKGKIEVSKSQAAFLSFCALIGLASLSLVLQIQFPDPIGNYWFLSCLFSPFAGLYYWENATEDNEFKVKLEANDDETTTNLTVLGGKDDVERMASVMSLQQEGMVRVKGLFEATPPEQQL